MVKNAFQLVSLPSKTPPILFPTCKFLAMVCCLLSSASSPKLQGYNNSDNNKLLRIVQRRSAKNCLKKNVFRFLRKVGQREDLLLEEREF